MSERDFLKKMQEEILDTEDEINMDTVLNEVEEWDSLAFVSFIALARMMDCDGIDRQTVREAEKVRDLYALLKK